MVVSKYFSLAVTSAIRTQSVFPLIFKVGRIVDGPRIGGTATHQTEPFDFLHVPVRRDLAQPLNAGVLVLRVPAEAPQFYRAQSDLIASFTGSVSRPILNTPPPGPTARLGFSEWTLLDQIVADRLHVEAQFFTCFICTAPPRWGPRATWRGRPPLPARSRQRSPCARAERRLAPPAPPPCRPAAGSGSSPPRCGPDW